MSENFVRDIKAFFSTLMTVLGVSIDDPDLRVILLAHTLRLIRVLRRVGSLTVSHGACFVRFAGFFILL